MYSKCNRQETFMKHSLGLSILFLLPQLCIISQNIMLLLRKHAVQHDVLKL